MSPQENIMGTMPVKKLLITMSWPIMLSMFIQALYNMVDSICVAHVSDSDFLALSLAYPVQSLMIAVCVGTGAGFSAVLSRKLGEGNLEEAQTVACHGYLAYFLSWLAFVAVITAGTGTFFRMSTQDSAVIEAGIRYLSICGIFSFGMCFQFVAERILQACGHPIQYMIVQGVGALLNIILDPIFVFVLKLGVVGAAVATVIGQITGMVVGIVLVWRAKELHVSLRGFRLEKRILQEIYQIGGPAILVQSLSSIMSFGLNRILIAFSNTAVIVLGVYFKVQSFVLMPVFGINNGLIAIASYNYGARQRERISASIRFGLVFGMTIMTAGALVVAIGAPSILKVGFNASPDTLHVGISALRTVAPSFLMAGISVILSAAFQALNANRYSLLVSLFRQLVLILPMAWLLCLWNVDRVWLAFLVAEGITCILSLLFYRHVYRTKIMTIT